MHCTQHKFERHGAKIKIANRKMFAILNYKAAEPPKWRLCGEKKRIFCSKGFASLAFASVTVYRTIAK